MRMITEAAQKELALLAKMLKGKPGKKGPFFEGEKPGYADFILVAALTWCQRADTELWENLTSVGDGEFQALYGHSRNLVLRVRRPHVKGSTCQTPCARG